MVLQIVLMSMSFSFGVMSTLGVLYWHRALKRRVGVGETRRLRRQRLAEAMAFRASDGSPHVFVDSLMAAGRLQGDRQRSAGV